MADDDKVQTYYCLALDPIHIGAGGQRLGRVDMPIVREPGTNLPKLPGTSLAGVARSATAMATDNKYPKCAGKSENVQGDDTGDQCGEPDCPICVPYGYGVGKRNEALHGMAQFFDAHVLFFPVYSMVGTVWVTSASALSPFGETTVTNIANDVCRVAQGMTRLPTIQGEERLNLGWLYLPVEEPRIVESNIKFSGKFPERLGETVLPRVVQVSDGLFARIVNANLERRTSVSIDPFTGAAADGALFTYEAIPRATVFQFTITYNDPKHFKTGGRNGTAIRKDIAWVKEQVHIGLRCMKDLGVGGMNTRGMGRLEVFC